MKRLIALLPTSVSRPVRILAWLSLVFQVILIGTGGAVRLTGSGLGCPTWPRCTDTSFVSTPEMGIHGVIEFANRMLTFVLALIVVAVFAAVVRYWTERRDLFVLTLLQGLSIPLQAVIGGITVLTGLNPYIVGVHFVISILLVINATILVYRVYRGPRGARRIAPLWYLIVAHTASLFVAITVVIGILTTGSGPHAGDEKTPRNGLDAELLQHFHSWPAYVLLGLTLVLVAAAWALKLDVRRWALALLLIEAVQVVVGLTQARLGLPPLLVGIHMVLAGLLVAAMTAVVLSLRSSANAPEAVDDPWELSSAGQRL
ncbi:COX15/CtaA family protein [Agreia pratensis]|uniref:Cytochrome c oxidase assembly protein subunit 15 n=1 Tax=Agreia pratensis TaxID=150121 RepID=A0A1X7KDB5_9MICO|nr:COX15/CtaA family protein [Agreia pratensis]SMG38426.1 cytochrome c oxidase assembly protein subunit 15 [Agreia pratensis]